MEDQGNMCNKLGDEPTSISSPTRSLEPVCSQIDVRDASEIRFERCTYSWKDKLNFLMTPISCQNSPRVIGKSLNKSDI
jgi:hypothetical protein